MTTDIRISLPEELRAAMEAAAEAEGKTFDELAAEAMERYLAHQWLDRMAHDGQERKRCLGLKTEQDVQRLVDRAIAEHRRERSR